MEGGGGDFFGQGIDSDYEYAKAPQKFKGFDLDLDLLQEIRRKSSHDEKRH